jgi:type IV secretory pathway TrbD component
VLAKLLVLTKFLAPMQSRLFLPTARQTHWLLVVGFLALGEALYLRYLAIEYGPVALACQAGLQTWLCATFRLVIVLFNHTVFGWVALAAALLNLLRPSLVFVSVALAAAGFGLVLHNADLSGLAVALLVVSLARPAPAPEW